MNADRLRRHLVQWLRNGVVGGCPDRPIRFVGSRAFLQSAADAPKRLPRSELEAVTCDSVHSTSPPPCLLQYIFRSETNTAGEGADRL